MSRRIWMRAAALACVWTSSAAHADSSWLGISALGWGQRPGFFLAPGLSGGAQQLPRWNSTANTGAAVGGTPVTGTPFSTRPSLSGAEQGVTAGYVFGPGALPAWMGERVRIGLTGSVLTYNQSEQTGAIAHINQGVVHLHVDGNVAQGYGTGAGGTPITESLRMLRQSFDLNLRVASDFTLLPDLTLTPSVAVYGGRTLDKYSYAHSGILGGNTLISFSLEERLRTNVFGGDVAVGLTWRASRALAISATGRVGPVWQRTLLEAASSCARAGGACSQTAAFTTSNTSTVGVRTGASLGAAVDMGFGMLSIGGFMTYDSQVPGVRNPVPTTINAAGRQGGPAGIRFDEGFGYGGFLTLRIPIL